MLLTSIYINTKLISIFLRYFLLVKEYSYVNNKDIYFTIYLSNKI